MLVALSGAAENYGNNTPYGDSPEQNQLQNQLQKCSPTKQAAAAKRKSDSQSAVTAVKRSVLERPWGEGGSPATGWRGRELLWLWLGLGELVGGTCRRRRGRIDLRRGDLLGGL